MSCNAWEHGTIKLPAAETRAVREAVRKAVNDATTLFYDKAQEFWKALPARAKRDAAAYREAINDFLYGPHAGDWRTDYTPRYGLGIPEGLIEDFSELLGWKGLERQATTAGIYVEKPKRIKQKTAAEYFGKATGSNFVLQYDGAAITFNGREVTYSADDNHGCDRPREHFISQALWSALNEVNWTRGSGGQIRGNNEYNEESGRDYAGGGGSYVVMEWSLKVQKAKQTVSNRRYYT